MRKLPKPKKLRKSRSRSVKSCRSQLRANDFLCTVPAAFPPEVARTIYDIDFKPVLDVTEGKFVRYGEPCFGKGALSLLLAEAYRGCGYLSHASDINPERAPEGVRVRALDARTLTVGDLEEGVDVWVTNTPWHRTHLFPIIDNLTKIAPLWCVLPAEFSQRRKSYEYMCRCTHILPIGPVQFRATKTSNGYFCYSWYRFTGHANNSPPMFIPRLPQSVKKGTLDAY